MEARNLMIGDTISVKPSGMPIKVAAVHRKKVAYHAVINKLAWVRESLLEPIPLTQEILEKNGFSNKGTLWYLEEDNFELEHNNNDSFIWIVGDVYIVASIKYVHELQQALRLCGIEKEIVL